MHFHQCRCLPEHVRMLLQSLRAQCKAVEGAGSIWKYFEALVRATREPGRFGYSFRTEWHFADGSVWLFRVAKLFGYDFQTILHFADGCRGMLSCNLIGNTSNFHAYIKTISLTLIERSYASWIKFSGGATGVSVLVSLAEHISPTYLIQCRGECIMRILLIL
jgi:hypothetical protein